VVTATWAVAVALIDARSEVLVRPSIALAILGPLLAWSIFTAVLARRTPRFLLTPAAQVIDIAFGVVVVAAEWVTYDGDHPLRFGAMWQLAPIIGAGLRYGAFGGLATGMGLGLVNAAALGITEGFDGRIIATLSAVVLLGVAGAAAGAILDRLRRAEDDLAEARARERIARTLHDGVLQTLAVIQRRSDDADLVALAAAQDQDLRRWIRGEADGDTETNLVEGLHTMAEQIRARDAMVVNVVAVGSPKVTPVDREALLGAVNEAVTNAVKHGAPTTVTVFLDVEDDMLVCSVSDDGCGFEPERTGTGLGMENSMRVPIESIGGDLQIRSRPGIGTEVEMRIPYARGSSAEEARGRTRRP
jgi:signal transduction histidine kinase